MKSIQFLCGLALTTLVAEETLASKKIYCPDPEVVHKALLKSHVEISLPHPFFFQDQNLEFRGGFPPPQ
jgi:hypothetical protein